MEKKAAKLGEKGKVFVSIFTEDKEDGDKTVKFSPQDFMTRCVKWGLQ